MKNRRGGGNFRDKRVTFQFRIFRIPEIFSSLMKNFFRRVKDLARSIYLFRIFPLPSPSESHRSCSILFHHRGRTVCLDTLPNNTLLIIATIIPWTITKWSVVTLCIREVQRMSCVTKNLCNVTRLNLIKLGGFGCENWMGNFGLINFPLYLHSYLKRSPLVHQCISFHPENYRSIPFVNLSFRSNGTNTPPHAHGSKRYSAKFQIIDSFPLTNCRNSKEFQVISMQFGSRPAVPLSIHRWIHPMGENRAPKIFETPREEKRCTHRYKRA